MKTFMKMGAIMLLTLFTQNLFAQIAASGDYRSIASGNWSAFSTWQIRDGSGNWTTPVSVPSSTNNVYVQAGHKIAVDVATANCNNLHLQTTDSLNVGSNTLQVSGKIRSYNSLPITNLAVASGVATLTTGSNHGFAINDVVVLVGFASTISSVTTTALNTTVTITAVTATTFNFTTTVGNITSTASGTTAASVTKSNNAVTGSVDGTFYTGQFSSTSVNSSMCTSTSGVGTLRFIGNTRNIVNTGEWTSNSIAFLSDVVFALTAGQTDSLLTVFGGRNVTFLSGTTYATKSITASNGTTGSGTVTIKNGATLSSGYSGTSNQVVCRTSSAACASLTIESGGTLELTGAAPAVDVLAFTNNGNVVYNRNGAQTMLTKGADATSINITSYNNLTIKTSSAKTIPSGIIINIAGTFTYAGSSSDTIATIGGSGMTYSAGATLALAGTSSLSLTLNQANIAWPLTNGPTNILVSANILSFTASAGISRTVAGTFTLNGGSFTTNLANTLTFANGATIVRGGAASSLSLNSGVINFGTAATDTIHLSILPSSTITSGNEFISTPVGVYGTLTIGAGAIFTVASGRTIAALNNSGILSLTTATPSTFTINGNLTGSGTISGTDSASIVIGGSGSGSAGTLNFTTGFEKMNNLTVNRTGTNGSVTISQAIAVNRNIAINSGTLAGGSSVFTVKGGITGSGTYTATAGGKIVLNGTTNSGVISISSATLANIELGSNGYSLTGSPTITGTFDVKNYVLRTSTSNLILATGANISRTSGWVFGGLRKNLATGTNVSNSFEVGDSLNYTPVALTFASITVAGTLTVKSVSPASAQANYATSPLHTSNYINRYWSLVSGGLIFTNYNATFNYVASDLLGTATAASVIAAKYSAGWSTIATTAGTNANTVNSITTTGDFILGNCGSLLTPSVIIATATDTVCSGNAVTFTATATNGGSAPVYTWKKNGNSVGSGSSITFPAGTLATNDVITCVLTANNICQTSATASSNSHTLTVKISPTIGVSTGFTACNLGSTIGMYNTNTQGSGLWSSSNTAVATVTTAANGGTGLVIPTGNGFSILTYTKTSSNGCVSTASDTVKVAVATPPNHITGTNSICKNSTTQLSSSTTGGVWSVLPTSYASINSTGLLNGNNAGIALVKYTVTNNSGCKADTSYTVTIHSFPATPSIGYQAGTPNPQYGPGGAFCANKTFTVAGSPSGGVWSKTGVITVTTPAGVLNTGSVAGSATLTYTYTDGFGCSSSRTIVGNVVVCASRGVNGAINEKQETRNEFSMYPNPAKSFISLQVKTLIGTGSIVVTDLYGKQAKVQPLSLGNNTVDITTLAKGIYRVSVITSEGKITKKLIVE